MRYLVIVLALTINVALVKAGAGGQIGGCSVGASGSGSVDCGPPMTGYTYQINATRVENMMAPGYPVAYMYYQVSPTQNLTYFRSLGPTDPLWVESYIFNGDYVYFENDGDHLLNSCAKQPSGTWQYVLIEVVRKSVLLGGDCSVNKGSYMVNQTVDPITVTFPEMIKCGENNLVFNGYVSSIPGESLTNPHPQWTWAFQFFFTFETNGTCDEL